MLNSFSYKSSSKNLVSERLKSIITYDRNELSGEMIEIMKLEIFKIINKYIEINILDVKIELIKNTVDESNYSTLIANIPLKR